MDILKIFKKKSIPNNPYLSIGGLIPPSMSQAGLLNLYASCGWLHAVVFRIALGCSEVEWTLFDSSNPEKPRQIYKHPILTLLKQVNPFQTSNEFIALDTIYNELIGESYWVLNNNALGEPAEIILPYPQKMSVVPAANFPYVKGYVYGVGVEAVPFGVDEVIHFKYPNPLNQYHGLAPAQAIGINLDAEQNADKWVNQFFYNSARPDGVIEFNYDLSDEQFDKLKRQWSSNFRGVNKAHQVAILQGGGSFKQVQNTIKDMDFPNLKQKNRDVILGVWGMPQSVMGISENVNKANAEAGDYQFARWLVKPRLDWKKAKLQEQLIRKFRKSDNLTLGFKEVVPETAEQKVLSAESGMRAGYLTINEARTMQGYDPLPNGDMLLVPLNLIPTPISGSSSGRTVGFEPAKDSSNLSPLAKLTPAEWEDNYAEGTPHWAIDMNPSLFAQEFVEELKSNKLSKLLEVGCGNGRDSIFFSRAGMNVTAIDVSPSAIELAQSNANKEEITNIRFMVANVEELPFADNEFESLFTLSVIHSTNLQKTIPQIARVVRKGGLVFIYLYADTEYVSGKVENHITVDDFTTLLHDNEFEIMDFYSEQEDEFDEYGEKHNILVTLLRR